MSDLAALRQFVVSDRQAEVLEAVIEHGSASKAARALSIDRRGLDRTLARIKSRAASKGWAPEHDYIHPVPDGFAPRGQSTLYDADGNVMMTWVKSNADRERMEQIIREAVAAMGESLPREKPVKVGLKQYSADLLNLYPITDFHLGMYAWREETGADWDQDIAEEMLVNWFGAAIAASPNAGIGVLAQLGDFLHWDGMEAVTPEHHNILDADTRFELLVRTAIRVLRRVVRMLLDKHARVHIIMAEGNHDPASSVWLRESFAAFYEDEPRITVDVSPDPYHCYEFGSTTLFFHHGHKKKLGTVDDVFARKFREEWGRTKYSYAHIGHTHNAALKESNLMVVEQHRTLAASDAYASRGGWIAGRSASAITYHTEYGEVGRVVLTPEMVS